MKRQSILLTLLFFYCALFSQELVDHKIGKGGFLDLRFQKIDSLYYQIGVFDDNITVGFNEESQTISELGNNKEDQIYVVKYDLDFKIVWASAIEASDEASKLQMKYHDGFLYIFWAQRNVDKFLHYCHRVNINDPLDVDFVLRFETGLNGASYDFEISDNGAIAVAGTYTDRVKFYFNSQPDKEYFCNSEQNIFLARYRILGDGFSFSHIVQREWGNPGSNKREFSAIRFDANENIHLFGYGNGSVQLDGNLGEAIGNGAAFQVTYSQTNDLLQFKETDLLFFFPPQIIPIDNNNFGIVGGSEYTILDENMDVVSTRSVEYNTNQKIIDVAVSEDSYTVLFEFRQSIHPLSLNDFTFKTHSLDYALINYDFEGNMQWYSYFGGDSQSDLPISVDYLENGNLLVCGNTNDNLDIDPSHNVVKYKYDLNRFFVAEYSTLCNGLSTGIKNISHITCSENAQLEFGINGGTSPHQFYFDNQLIENYEAVEVAEIGLYEAYVIDQENCSKSIHIPVTGPSLNPNEKLRLHQSAAEFRTGFETHIFYSLNNDNCIPRSGKVKIVLDDQIEYINASIAPTQIDNQTLEFGYNDLVYKDSIFKLKLDLKISEDAAFGNDLCARIYIFDALGVQIDQSIICKEVVNSYDPNDISVAPYGRCEENFFLNEETLEYTIRFQNLGNAEAINIEIVDTLSTALDINSFMQTATSHEAKVYIVEDSILIINYKNIYLPAAEQDEVASNGFFSYRIRAFPDQEIYTEIDNRAAIYFDFNDPVITNTVKSTLIDNLPACIVTNVNDVKNDILHYYPNPANDLLTIEHRPTLNIRIELFDILGMNYEVLMTKSNAKTVLDLSTLRSGMYFAKVGDSVIAFYRE